MTLSQLLTVSGLICKKSLMLGSLAASQFLSELDKKLIQTRQAEVLSHNYKASYQQQTSVTTELTLSLGFYVSWSLAGKKPKP